MAFKIGDLLQFPPDVNTHLWVIDSIDYDAGTAYLTDMNDGVTSQSMFISFLNQYATVKESGVAVAQPTPAIGSTQTPTSTATTAIGSGCLLALLGIR